MKIFPSTMRYGKAVWKVLDQQGEMTLAELTVAAGLSSESQAHAGVHYARNFIGPVEKRGLIFDRTTWTYRLSEENEAAAQYGVYQLRYTLTRDATAARTIMATARGNSREARTARQIARTMYASAQVHLQTLDALNEMVTVDLTDKELGFATTSRA